MEEFVGFVGCVNKKISRKEANMSKKCLSLALVLLLVIPSIAEAESLFEENFEREQKELKSEGQALTMSLVATAAPVVLGGVFLSGSNDEAGLALAFGGLIAGPSTGHFYAGQTKRGLIGIGIRAAIVAGGTYLIYSATGDQHPDSRGFSEGAGIIAVSAVTLIHGMYDIFTAPSSVRKYNESLLEENSLILVPEVDPFNESYGLSIVYNF